MKKKCGNCFFWMKSSLCPKEKNIKGMSRGPSVDGFPCEKFKPNPILEEVKRKMMSVEIMRPSVNVEYMIAEHIMKKSDPRYWWVVWYNSKTLGSVGMDEFETFNQAMMWDMENPPRSLDGVEYDRSTIVYSGDE